MECTNCQNRYRPQDASQARNLGYGVEVTFACLTCETLDSFVLSHDDFKALSERRAEIISGKYQKQEESTSSLQEGAHGHSMSIGLIMREARDHLDEIEGVDDLTLYWRAYPAPQGGEVKLGRRRP